MLAELKVLQPKNRLKIVTGAYVQPQPFLVNVHRIGENHFHDDLDYVFITEQEAALPPAAGESDEIRWMNLAEIRSLPDDMMLANVRDIFEYLMTNLLSNLEWEAIPADAFVVDSPNI